MTALETRKAVQRLLGVADDGAFGPKTMGAYYLLASTAGSVEWPSGDDRIISAPGWAFQVRVQGDDLCVDNCRATCFGGSDDPQDSGQTASGISTKENPNIQAVSLPMDFGDRVANTKGSPIPRLPWKTMVEVTHEGVTRAFGLIDIGPAKRTGNAIDLTIAAARLFNPKATARNFEMRCSYRIIGGAKFLTT